MEYVSGGELFDYIVSRGRLPADEARRFFHQIVSAVEYCHYHHIVHRDLKPENLLLDSDNNIKLADFGLSNVVHDGHFLRTSCGSPNYAAPEVISGNLYAGPEVDVWSCGVILYAVLCGTLPFDDESIPNLFKKIKSGMYSLPSHLSQLSRDLILRMLVVDPMKRITVPDIREHSWYIHKLPTYLALPPEKIESQDYKIDDEIISLVAELPIRGVNQEIIMEAILGMKSRVKLNRRMHDLYIAYELLLHAKHKKQHIADAYAAQQQQASTPIAQSPIVDFSLAGTTPPTPMTPISSYMENSPVMNNNSMRRGQSHSTSSSGSHNTAPRRRWYLGIQSKKDPAHVMTEVFKAMHALDCHWHAVNNYRVLCLWDQGEGSNDSKMTITKSKFDNDNVAPSRRSSGGQTSPTTFVQGHVTIKMNDDLTVVADGTGNDIGADSTDHSSSMAMDTGNSSSGWQNGEMMGESNGDSGQGMREMPVLDELLLDKSKGANKEMEIDFDTANTSEEGKPMKTKAALSLYKVQRSIYLLDFQRIEGDPFSFMKLCALIVTELKKLSAATRNAKAAKAAISTSAPSSSIIGQGTSPLDALAGVASPGNSQSLNPKHTDNKQMQCAHSLGGTDSVFQKPATTATETAMEASGNAVDEVH